MFISWMKLKYNKYYIYNEKRKNLTKIRNVASATNWNKNEV